MHRFRFAALAGVAVIGFASVGSAADMPVKAPVVVAAPAYNWTGFYIGANIGGGWDSHGANFATDDASNQFFEPGPAGLLPRSSSFTSSGVIGGLQLGYNWQLDPYWLIGVETDFSGSGIKGAATNSGATIGFPIAESVDERVNWFGTLRARLGYLPMNNFLTYVTGGLAYGQVDRTGNLVNTTSAGFNSTGTTNFVCNGNSTCFAGSASNTAIGWALGGGFEYGLWRNMTVKAEYLYISFGGGSLTETAVGAPSPPSTINVTYGRTNLNAARLGMNWHF